MKNEKQPLAMHFAPRCGAKCKRTGLPCKGPAMANGRCRLHGGKSTGAPKGNKNALKHGLYTKEMLAEKKAVQKLLNQAKETLSQFH